MTPHAMSSVALACKGPINARLVTGVGLSLFSFYTCDAATLLKWDWASTAFSGWA
jgi:hypothetical protein